MTWRDILGRDVDWVAVNGGKYRATAGLRRLFADKPLWAGNRFDPITRVYGDWYQLTLGEIANLGRASWIREPDVGPVMCDLIERVIDAAADGKPVAKGSSQIGASSYIPNCERGKP